MNRFAASRDVLLGSAAAALASGAIFGSVARLLQFIDSFDGERTGSIVGSGFQMLAFFGFVPVFALAAVALFGSPHARSRRFCLAFGLAAISLLLGAIGRSLISFVYATTDFLPGTLLASEIVATGAWLSGCLGAWVAAIAFLRSPSSGLSVRDERLGWAAGFGSAFFLLGAAALTLEVIFFSDLGATSQLTAGLGVVAVGNFIATAALMVVAVAFLTASFRDSDLGDGWRARRETLLGAAAVVFGAAYLLVMIGSFLDASAFSENGLSGTATASAWLSAAESIFVFGATVCAGLAFLLTRSGRSVFGDPAPS